MSASMVSRSRWLVGSSRHTRCGFVHVICANATRLFCPPDSVPIFCSARSPLMPNLPRCDRTASRLADGPNLCSMCSTGLRCRSSCATWCCVKTAVRRRPLRVTWPEVALRLPRSRLSSVDLPAPFGPRIAMRLSVSTPNSTPVNSVFSGV
mmetsp:Transcript_3192/g.11555  ORF Transcript_3192/g.11555 Transcript_3192/m.11555 type:complete len:151 (-) Transcript_3192:1123-1575(-)